MKWNETPVTLSFTEKEATISMIPFPAITICPETKANKDKLDLMAAYEFVKSTGKNLSSIE